MVLTAQHISTGQLKVSVKAFDPAKLIGKEFFRYQKHLKLLSQNCQEYYFEEYEALPFTVTEKETGVECLIGITLKRFRPIGIKKWPAEAAIFHNSKIEKAKEGFATFLIQKI